MIKISKDKNILEVTKGVYENLYKGMGYEIVTDAPKKDFVEAKVIDKVEEKNNETAENKEQVKQEVKRSNRK